MQGWACLDLFPHGGAGGGYWKTSQPSLAWLFEAPRQTCAVKGVFFLCVLF